MADGGSGRGGIRISAFQRCPAASRFRPSPFPVPLVSLLHRHHQIPLSQPQRQLHRFGQPRTHLRSDHQPVDHHLDVVPHLAVQPQVVAEADHAAIDPGAGEPLLQQVGEQVAVLALLAANQRRQHEKSRARRQGHDAVDDLLAGLGGDRPAALRTVSLAHPGEQHPQIIVNLGDRADRGARALPARLLRDRDGRVQPGDQVHVGLGHLPEKLPGETGETLHVAPLPLGIERVEGQRTLPRPAHPREANQPVAGQHQIDVAQIVLSGAANEDVGSGHGVWWGRHSCCPICRRSAGRRNVCPTVVRTRAGAKHVIVSKTQIVQRGDSSRRSAAVFRVSSSHSAHFAPSVHFVEIWPLELMPSAKSADSLKV